MVILNAILPVFLVILSGYTIRRLLQLDDTFWNKVDKLIFNVLLPLMLIKVLSEAPISPESLKVGAVVFVSITIVSAICFMFRLLPNLSGPSFTSVFQGAVRVNFYIALSIASILYGDQGIKIMSYILIFLIPGGVTYSILVMQKYGEVEDGVCKKTIVSALTKNPIIIATIIGITLGMFIDEMPIILGRAFEIFGQATLPLALLGVGAAINLKGIKPLIIPSLISSSLRLVIAPIICLGLASIVDLTQTQTACALLVMGVPSAASAITFSTQMGGDTPLMSAILTTQTLISLITLSTFMIFIF